MGIEVFENYECEGQLSLDVIEDENNHVKQWINKIICGNSLELIKKLPDNSVDVSFTSPPYNRIRNDTYDLYDDVLDDYYSMITKITDEMIRVTKREVIVNIQMILFNKQDVCKYIGNYADKIKGIIVWEKNNPQPACNPKNGTFSVTNAYEFFFVISANYDIEFRANQRIKNIIHTNVNSEHFQGHGAVMKKEVCEWFIENFTKKGMTVLDPFMGMGTTGLVCAQKHRNYVGFEIVPEYCERANKRIEQETAQMNLFDYLGE